MRLKFNQAEKSGSQKEAQLVYLLQIFHQQRYAISRDGSCFLRSTLIADIRQLKKSIRVRIPYQGGITWRSSLDPCRSARPRQLQSSRLSAPVRRDPPALNAVTPLPVVALFRPSCILSANREPLPTDIAGKAAPRDFMPNKSFKGTPQDVRDRGHCYIFDYDRSILLERCRSSIITISKIRLTSRRLKAQPTRVRFIMHRSTNMSH